MLTLQHVGLSWVVWKGGIALRAFARRADAVAFLHHISSSETAGEAACAFL